MLEKFRKNLVIKMTVIFLVAAAVPYVLVSSLYYRSSKQELMRGITARLLTDAELFGSSVDLKLFNDSSNVAAWAGLDIMRDIVVDDVDKRIARVITNLKRDYGITGNIYVFNAKGRIIASTNRTSVGTALAGPWVSKALGGERVNVSEKELGEAEATVAMVEPVKAAFGDKKTIGAVVVERKIRELFVDVDAEKIHLAAIIDKDGNLLAALPDDEHSREVIGAWKGEKKKVVTVEGDILVSALEKGAYGMKGFGWTYLLAVDEKEAMAPIRYLARVNLLIGLFGLILITGLVYMFAISTVRPLVKLSDAAAHIAKTKDFSSFVTVNTHDEVGRLATSFNHMVAEIKGYIDRIHDMEDDMVRTDRLAALAELSAGMAHEIRNPLGVVKCSAEILLEKADPKSMEGELLQAVWEESGRLEKLLESFLQFARPRPPQMSPCQINNEIESVMLLLSPQIKKYRVEASLKLEDGLPGIMSDANQLHQVFINIVINSLQAMPNGGWIKISTERSKGFRPGEPTVEIDTVRVCISDTGSGIDAETMRKIFNPFFTTKAQGTGLGLSIVQRIITGLGGWVKINSLPMRGTEFNIYLPV